MPMTQIRAWLLPVLAAWPHARCPPTQPQHARPARRRVRRRHPVGKTCRAGGAHRAPGCPGRGTCGGRAPAGRLGGGCRAGRRGVRTPAGQRRLAGGRGGQGAWRGRAPGHPPCHLDRPQGRPRPVAFDHGAPGFSADSADFAEQAARWQADGVLLPWQPRVSPDSYQALQTPRLWRPRPDMPALVRHLLQGLPCLLNQTVTALYHGPEGWHWRAAEPAPCSPTGPAAAKASATRASGQRHTCHGSAAPPGAGLAAGAAGAAALALARRLGTPRPPDPPAALLDLDGRGQPGRHLACLAGQLAHPGPACPADPARPLGRAQHRPAGPAR